MQARLPAGVVAAVCLEKPRILVRVYLMNV
jgi:hypothetical protein